MNINQLHLIKIIICRSKNYVFLKILEDHTHANPTILYPGMV